MRWLQKNYRDAYEALGRQTNLPALTRLLLANRGVDHAQAHAYLHPEETDLFDPFLFREMEQAVEYLAECLEAEIPIQIVGDYDQDGVAATTILMQGIGAIAEAIGVDALHAISYQVPDRVEEGYGIKPSHVDRAAEDGVGLLITCDNGIAAFEAMDRAQELGIPVIVTDHHQPVMEEGAFRRPNCDVLINPHVPGEDVPTREICGATVAYKVVEALATALHVDLPVRDDLLGWAALGTICDVMPLQGENRALVAQGLRALNRSTNPGLHALLQEVGWERPITVYTAGFIIGPCINASGRLLTARLGIELFLERDPIILRGYAHELVTLNDERKQMTKEGVEKALIQIVQKPLPSVIAEVVMDVHESVCGLIAGRVREQTGRPTLIFTRTEEGVLKGSGRSIPAYDMFNALNEEREHYLAFGGHKMACGMSLREEDLPYLKERWNRASGLAEEDFIATIDFDSLLPFRLVHQDTLAQIHAIEPIGNGNPSALFAARAVNVLGLKLVGKNKNVLQLLVEQDGVRLRGVLFQGDQHIDALRKGPAMEQVRALETILGGGQAPLQFDLLYVPEENVFRGQKRIELKVKDVRFHRV